MNKISIVGRLAADSETRYTAGGDPILNFRVADDVGYGERKSTNWWQCSLFGKRAESLEQYLKRGQQVTVFGTAQMREWTNKDGIKQLSPDIRVDYVQLTGSKDSSQSSQQYDKKDSGGLADIDDSDIPF